MSGRKGLGARGSGLGAAVRWADRFALIGMLIGAALMFQPCWRPGLGWGFWVLLSATVAHIITSHLRPSPQPPAPQPRAEGAQPRAEGP